VSADRRGEIALYRRLLLQARPFWPHIAAVFAVSLLATPLALLTPLPLKIAVDSVIGSHPLPPLVDALVPHALARSPMSLAVFSAGLVVVVALFTQLQGLAQWVLHTWTGERLVLRFREQLFSHVQRLSIAYHDTRGTTDSTYRIQYDAAAIQYVTLDGVIPFVSASVTLLGMIYVTARIDWPLAVVAVAVAPALYVLSRASSRRLRARWFEVKESESSAMTVVQEVLGAVRLVKAFGREDYEHGRFLRQAARGMRGQVHVALVGGSFTVLVGMVIALGTAAALAVGLLHVKSGRITVGALLMVMAYLAQLYTPLEGISKRIAVLQSSLASAQRAFALLDERPDVKERPNPRPLGRATGAVEFRNVSFSYDGNRPALRDVSFSVAPGTRVGIAGRTGAGKTTLVNLLTRFYDPQAGEIFLDGLDLRAYRLADLRNQFALVLQEPVLFSTSIAENIGYARPTAAHAEIVEAAQAADAHDFIMRLPERYESRVGERGMRLSGGERQRIALARAFLKDAPILVLDEPTSSVDTRTEAAIMQAMERLMRGRTTFMIAHRLTTLERSDVVLVIQRGRLLRTTTGVLVLRDGTYAVAGEGDDLEPRRGGSTG
jgi:ATP-binding cassette, subfamily B, bacterial